MRPLNKYGSGAPAGAARPYVLNPESGHAIRRVRLGRTTHMHIANVKERIKVRADFSPGGSVSPLLFKRKSREAFRVTRVNATWEDREQRHKILYFSVLTDRSDDVFQLSYREEDRSWWLDCVMMDG